MQYFCLGRSDPCSCFPLGDCSSEKGSTDPTDIYFYELWENADWFQKGYASCRFLNLPAANQNDVRFASIETGKRVSGMSSHALKGNRGSEATYDLPLQPSHPLRAPEERDSNSHSKRDTTAGYL